MLKYIGERQSLLGLIAQQLYFISVRPAPTIIPFHLADAAWSVT